jgi:hypothetical protein
MRGMALGVALMLTVVSSLSGQVSRPEPIEIPLRVHDGRLMVTAHGPEGATYDFVLGLGMTLISESGAARIGDSMSALTLGGIPVNTESSQTVPDSYLSTDAAVGILGGMTLTNYDILIDVPGERLLLKPIGRSVRWDGHSLSSPVGLSVMHDVLLRADVEIGGKVVGGLIDLASPGLEINEPLRSATVNGRVDKFRLGYSGWTDLPAEVSDAPLFQGWDPENRGFVVIGAAIAYDCAIAISWKHAELRTCLR